MTTIQTAQTPARFRRTSAVVTAAGALIAIGVAALFLALAGPTRTSHVAIRHSVPMYHGTYYPRIQHHGTNYPLIQYRGTGAPPATATVARPTTPTVARPTTPPVASRGLAFLVH
jgi:hypothetical protein